MVNVLVQYVKRIFLNCEDFLVPPARAVGERGASGKPYEIVLKNIQKYENLIRKALDKIIKL
jgi:hypothetical protein